MDRRRRLQDIGGHSMDELVEDVNHKLDLESGVLSREPLEDLQEENSSGTERERKSSCPTRGGGWRRQTDTKRRQGFLRQETAKFSLFYFVNFTVQFSRNVRHQLRPKPKSRPSLMRHIGLVFQLE